MMTTGDGRKTNVQEVRPLSLPFLTDPYLQYVITIRGSQLGRHRLHSCDTEEYSLLAESLFMTSHSE